jgi:hypothetical protein
MFSLDKFYNILHDNLISQFPAGKSISFYPFGTYQNLIEQVDKNKLNFQKEFVIPKKTYFNCYFFDQEPFYDSTLDILNHVVGSDSKLLGPNNINIVAVSEISKLPLPDNYKVWYYFFHGFAALDWYRDFQFLTPASFNQFDKVFICYNHLTGNLRSYRLHLVSNLIEQDLVQHGHVSLFHDNWQETIHDANNPLDNRARVKIFESLKNLTNPLTIDTNSPNGNLSASVTHAGLTSALWHVVTETIYFDSKLHLTEKIFKPIVSRRPFILAAAPGNLAYLKSYGFRTFDQWIDESYDEETDHYVRIEKITAEIARLCAMSPATLKQIHKEMQEVLEYNFNHFYTTFKDRIVDELVDNFSDVLKQINHGRIPGNHSRHHQRFELTPNYLDQVKKRLKQ